METDVVFYNGLHHHCFLKIANIWLRSV